MFQTQRTIENRKRQESAERAMIADEVRQEAARAAERLAKMDQQANGSFEARVGGRRALRHRTLTRVRCANETMFLSENGELFREGRGGGVYDLVLLNSLPLGRSQTDHLNDLRRIVQDLKKVGR